MLKIEILKENSHRSANNSTERWQSSKIYELQGIWATWSRGSTMEMCIMYDDVRKALKEEVAVWLSLKICRWRWVGRYSRRCAHYLAMKEYRSLGKYKLCHTSPESLGHERCVAENWLSLQDPWLIAVKAMASLTGKEYNRKRCFIIKIFSHELFHESSCR